MSMNYETLLVTKESGITTIAFNRPEKRNAMVLTVEFAWKYIAQPNGILVALD